MEKIKVRFGGSRACLLKNFDISILKSIACQKAFLNLNAYAGNGNRVVDNIQHTSNIKDFQGHIVNPGYYPIARKTLDIFAYKIVVRFSQKVSEILFRKKPLFVVYRI